MRHLLACAVLIAAAYAQCPVTTIILKGHVENPTPDSRVRAQLSYPKAQSGESAETTLDNGSFHLPLEFLTQSTRPFLRNVKPKCDRKPAEVILTLVTGDAEKNQLTLAFPRDFTLTDASAYTPTTEVVFKDAP